MHLHSIPARIRDHHRRDAFYYGIVIRWHMDAQQAVLTDNGVVLIDAHVCSTIPNIVL